MTAKLRALVVLVGTAIVGATTVYFYEPAPGTTMAMLVDAGIRKCAPGVARGVAHCPKTDGGQGKFYRAFEKKAPDCGDGGERHLGFRDIPEGCTLFRPDLFRWTQLADDGGASTVDVAHECACLPWDGGVCRRSDGGSWPAGWNNTMPAGSWLVTDKCVPKSCGEVAGESSWPAECVPQ